ncbi:MAG: hypothetical protein IIA23_07700 [Chloroflexi bacterium]|nr:hypothetical protein [Chloroflexota bacterium]
MADGVEVFRYGAAPRGLVRTSAGVGFEDRGEQTLKGIAEPQRTFVVRGGGA